MLPLYYDPIYTEGIDSSARFPRDRYRLLAQRLEGHTGIDIRRPRLATCDEITRAHCPDYIEQFIQGTLSLDAIRRIGLRPWTPDIVERTLRITGGSLQALEHVLHQGGIAGNMAGGTHHAYYNYGSGYCIFNDIAICAFTAVQHPKVQRVLILDLDVHQGDGTAAICASHPGIFTCSIHAESNFPFRKQQSDLDVHLGDATNDKDYLDLLNRTLEKLQPEQYDLILFQAGVDPLKEDSLGKLALSRTGLAKRNQRILDIHREHKIPIVLFMGGGYANPITPTVDAFEDLFTAACTAV